MTYEEKLNNVTVLGAAGKMGSGILLLTAIEMTDIFLKAGKEPGSMILNAIDVSAAALYGLRDYLRDQIRKIAEKKIVILRNLYSKNPFLIENSEIIEHYIYDVMKHIVFTTRLESSYQSTIIFEAVVEDPEIKINLLRQIAGNSNRDPWFFTNTSSVPVSELEKGADLAGRIIGFHFYNPPAVQNLVELITTDKTDKELVDFAKLYAKSLSKKIIPANDYPGFIGNGHFMRDLLFGFRMAEKLSDEFAFAGSIYAVNRISQDFLIRPMGIFQLMDYVGIDVCMKILEVMRSRLKDDQLHSELIDKLISARVNGGQNSDGSQKPGIFTYEKGKPVSVFDHDILKYIPVDSFRKVIDLRLGNLPSSWKSWKEVVNNKNNQDYLKDYFSELKRSGTPGAKLAIEFLANSKKTGLDLVKWGVADNIDNVNTVLLTGFYHAYGPVNDYLD